MIIWDLFMICHITSIQPQGLAHASACQSGRRGDVMVHTVLKFFCLALLFIENFNITKQ